MKCDVCNGQGEMFIIQGNPDYAIPETLTCEKCQGTGQLEVGNVAQPEATAEAHKRSYKKDGDYKELRMAKGKAKSKYNYETEFCEYEQNSWCTLPKSKRCKDCIRNEDGSKSCYVML